ncbi:helix-turn-helix transcriptional regulator [Fluviicoccus sp.]|uniref:helix-turn-helix transcriptional regulator n=1 Tax=Fluviicoccus sp. TaxID=2003552 RepID=UPI00351EF0D2
MRLPEVTKRAGLSVPTIYRRIKAGQYPPAQVSLGGSAVGWSEQAVSDWISGKLNQLAA